MSYYRGPSVFSPDGPYVHWWDRSQQHPRPALPLMVRSTPTDNMVAAYHESCHTCFNFYTDRGVHSVRLDGNGGGRFQAHVNDTRRPTLTGNELPTKIPTDDDGKLAWMKLLVGMHAPLVAQRRFAGRSYDGIATHDQLTIDRVLSCISSSTTEARIMRAEIERRARRFVALHWGAI
jgi:hypothetical protein